MTMTPTRTTTMEGRALAVGRSFVALGGFAVPFLLLAILFVFTYKALLKPTLIAFAVMIIGCVPDVIDKYRSRKVPARSSKELHSFVVVDEESPEHVRYSGQPKVKKENPPPARCFVAYVVFVLSLVIAAVVVMYR
jgi:uncharacterized membrane protein